MATSQGLAELSVTKTTYDLSRGFFEQCRIPYNMVAAFQVMSGSRAQVEAVSPFTTWTLKLHSNTSMVTGHQIWRKGTKSHFSVGGVS